MSRGSSKAKASNPASQHHHEGRLLLMAHPVFQPLDRRVNWIRSTAVYRAGFPWPSDDWPADAWLWLSRDEYLHAHPKRLAEPTVWAHVMARGLLYHALEL